MARILIIDDNLLIRTLLREILSDGGHEVVGQARNGLDAPRCLQELHPDVATLDLVMPGRTGFTTLHHLLMVDPLLAVVVCSAALSQSRIGEARRLGAMGFVDKPFDRRTVLDAVRDVVRDAGAHRVPGRPPAPSSSVPDWPTDQREFARVPAQLPVFVVAGDGTPWDTYTINIGGGGMLLASGSLEPDAGARFSLGLERGTAPIDGRGRVVRVGADGQSAFAFEQVSIDDHERLIRYLNALQAALS